MATDEKITPVNDEHESARLRHMHEPQAELVAHALINHGFQYDGRSGGPEKAAGEAVTPYQNYARGKHEVQVYPRGDWAYEHPDYADGAPREGGNHHDLVDFLRNLRSPATERADVRQDVSKAARLAEEKKTIEARERKTLSDGRVWHPETKDWRKDWRN